jgi:hypothetical protein
MQKNYRILAERYIALRQHTIRMQQQMQQLKVKIVEMSAASTLHPSNNSLTTSGERERSNSVVLSSGIELILL